MDMRSLREQDFVIFQRNSKKVLEESRCSQSEKTFAA